MAPRVSASYNIALKDLLHLDFTCYHSGCLFPRCNVANLGGEVFSVPVIAHVTSVSEQLSYIMAAMPHQVRMGRCGRPQYTTTYLSSDGGELPITKGPVPGCSPTLRSPSTLTVAGVVGDVRDERFFKDKEGVCSTACLNGTPRCSARRSSW